MKKKGEEFRAEMKRGFKAPGIQEIYDNVYESMKTFWDVDVRERNGFSGKDLNLYFVFLVGCLNHLCNLRSYFSGDHTDREKVEFLEEYYVKFSDRDMRFLVGEAEKRRFEKRGGASA